MQRNRQTGDVTAGLDPGFVPAIRWIQAHRKQCAAAESNARLELALERPDGTIYRQKDALLDDNAPASREQNYRHTERLVKNMLWQKGGSRVHISAPETLVDRIKADYAVGGARTFDSDTIGTKCFGEPIQIFHGAADDLPTPNEAALPLGKHLDGCRIGFDLGGSDRKAAAVVDGNVVFSEEIPWDPYFQSDINYHYEGILDSLNRAAAYLPRVDAIGGSAAGVYVNNEARIASLFRGIPEARFTEQVPGLFNRIKAKWGNIPFEVINDGDVTALAGSISIGSGAVLGIAMGTSLAAGYCDAAGHITGWLNELAFCPVDYRQHAPVDEWSGDAGCGVQYFSQQAVGRLAPVAGFEFDAAMPLPEQLEAVQAGMETADPRAGAIYRTLGRYLGHAIAYYAECYEIDHLLLMGRVTSGDGGSLMIESAKTLLKQQHPALSERINLTTPDEKMKRHGQAIAAASLPAI